MYDAWQAQQRAQKEQERNAKTEAAAALQGYRRSGLSEDETKLAALREHERLQKLNAEQQLHGYRSTLTEAEAKMAAQKQEELRRKQEYEEQIRNNGVVSSHDPSVGHDFKETLGVVSAIAAGYSAPNNVQTPMPAVTKENFTPTDLSSTIMPDPSPVIVTNGLSIISDPSPAIATNGISKPVVSDSTIAGTEESKANTLDTMPSIATAAGTEEALQGATQTFQVSAPTATSIETATPPPAPTPPAPTSVQSSVKFIFGILTTGDIGVSFPQDRSRLIEGYLARADQIAKSVIADNNSSSSSFESIMLSLAYPTASSVKKDDSRTDTNRILVTVTILFSAPDNVTCQDFPSQVIERVRAAISAGTFTKID